MTLEIETTGLLCSIIGEGDRVLLDVDANVSRALAFKIARLLMEDRNADR